MFHTGPRQVGLLKHGFSYVRALHTRYHQSLPREKIDIPHDGVLRIACINPRRRNQHFTATRDTAHDVVMRRQ